MENKILFVDDEPINLFLIERFFSKKMNIKTANSGKEALQILDSEPNGYFMVVSDLKMPIMDGFELLEEIKSKHPKLRRLLLTAFYQDGEISQKVESGIIEKVFQKTGDMNQLTQDFIQYLKETEK